MAKLPFVPPLRRNGVYLVDASDVIRLQAPGINIELHAPFLDFVAAALNKAASSRTAQAREFKRRFGFDRWPQA